MFIDSLQFLNVSLERLVSNVAKEGDVRFRVLKKYTAAEKAQLLLRKGVYPYEYISSFQKISRSRPPTYRGIFQYFTKRRYQLRALHTCTNCV